jgi:murein L,D-transpeptidase YafK
MNQKQIRSARQGRSGAQPSRRIARYFITMPDRLRFRAIRTAELNPASMRIIAPLLLTLLISGLARAEVWVQVDTEGGILSVLHDDRVMVEIGDIAIGRGGPSPVHKADDGTTPLGHYRIAWVNTDSIYHLFFGLDYPNWDDAFEGFSSGLIDEPTLLRISHALGRGLVPPQNTPLGGHIGIHGVGNGDLKVHRSFNWTEGCVAVSNEQIEQLAAWIRVGTRVVIK